MENLHGQYQTQHRRKTMNAWNSTLAPAHFKNDVRIPNAILNSLTSFYISHSRFTFLESVTSREGVVSVTDSKIGDKFGIFGIRLMQMFRCHTPAYITLRIHFIPTAKIYMWLLTLFNPTHT